MQVSALQYVNSPFLWAHDSSSRLADETLPQLQALLVDSSGPAGQQAAQSSAARHGPMARKHELLPVNEDPMALVCCNVLMRAYLAAEPLQWRRMVALVCSMNGAGLHMKADIVTYNSLLSGLVALNKVEVAFELVDSLARRRPQPSATTWRLLMHGAASAGLYGLCNDAWLNLLRSEAELDIDDINTAIFALIELGHWHDAWHVYETMRNEQQITPTERTLAMLAKPLHGPAASMSCARLIADAQSFGLPLPVAALEVLVDNLCISCCWGDAVTLVHSAIRRDDSVAVPVLRHLGDVMQRAAAAHAQAGMPVNLSLQDAYQQVLMLYRAATN